MPYDIGTYTSGYIPFTPNNCLPEPGDDISFAWLSAISQFTQRFTKIATAFATLNAYGSYLFDYSSLGCDYFPPFLQAYRYNPDGTSYMQITGQMPKNVVFFRQIGLNSALLQDKQNWEESDTWQENAYMLIAYL